MRLKTLFKLAVLSAVVFVAVKFGAVYVNAMQLRSILNAEALDARRARPNVESLIQQINSRVRRDELSLPEEMEFTVEGLDDPSADLVVTADYVEVVDLYVHKVTLPMHIVGRADAPE